MGRDSSPGLTWKLPLAGAGGQTQIISALCSVFCAALSPCSLFMDRSGAILTIVSLSFILGPALSLAAYDQLIFHIHPILK